VPVQVVSIVYGAEQIMPQTQTESDFSLAATPSSLSASPGSSVSTDVSSSNVNGSAQTITLSVSGLPPDVTAVFSPSNILAGDDSTLTFAANLGAFPGKYTVLVTGTGNNGVTHAIQVSLTIVPSVVAA
jgi:uncharacterized membrane protein